MHRSREDARKMEENEGMTCQGSGREQNGQQHLNLPRSQVKGGLGESVGVLILGVTQWNDDGIRSGLRNWRKEMETA